VREHLARQRELKVAVDAGETEALPLQKLAFEVAVRINTVTPHHATRAHHHGPCSGPIGP